MWKISWTGQSHSTTSGCMETGKVLSHVQEGSSNRLEYFLGLETPCLYENSFDLFVKKMQVCPWCLCAASLFFSLGLWLCIYVEGIRSERPSPKSLNQCFWIFDLPYLFPIFFNPFLCQSLPIILNLSLLNGARNIEWILCTKRFEKHGLVFFS